MSDSHPKTPMRIPFDFVFCSWAEDRAIGWIHSAEEIREMYLLFKDLANAD